MLNQFLFIPLFQRFFITLFQHLQITVYQTFTLQPWIKPLFISLNQHWFNAISTNCTHWERLKKAFENNDRSIPAGTVGLYDNESTWIGWDIIMMNNGFIQGWRVKVWLPVNFQCWNNVMKNRWNNVMKKTLIQHWILVIDWLPNFYTYCIISSMSLLK